MNPIDESLPGTVITWLRLWRSVVLEPLKAADPPWTLERMSAELTRRTQGDPLEGGARSDVSGTAKATLQRFFSGERVPARDVVQHLLDIADETLAPPPAREQVTDLWAAHRAALHTTFPLLADLYDALDQRDAARGRAEDLQRQKTRLAEDLALSRRQEQRLEVLLRHSAAELEHAQQTAIIQADEVRRARREVEELTRRLSELSEQYEQSRQDQERLESEIGLLREQDTSHALTRRISQLQAVMATVRQENEELEAMVRTVTVALHEARAAAAEAGSDNHSRHGQQQLPGEPRSGADSHAELERRHELAMHAVQHLSEELRGVSRQLADARAELIHRDGDLARLVEEHAQEIASLRADRVLAEADTVLSMALQHLDPAPAALPPARDVPAPETTGPPSSPGPAAAPRPPGQGDVVVPGSAPGGDDGLPPPDMTGPPGAAGSPHPAPDTASTSAQAPEAGSGQRPQVETGPQPALREVKIVTAALGAVLVGIFGISWAMDWPGDHGREPKATASATADRSARASASPLPRPPEKDPVADIADQEVNTAAVMKLRPCTKNDAHPSIRSLHNAYAQDHKPRIELILKADDHGRVPCRFDAARNRAAVAITAAGSDTPLWDSSTCTSGHDEHRWIQVTRSRPASIDFVWNRIPNDNNCQQTTRAEAGTYLVETTLLAKTSQTSFVLEADDAAGEQTSPSPSMPATQNTDASTGSSSNSGGSVGGLLSGGNGARTSDPPASESASASPSEDTGVNGSGGANGSGANGGGFFGGPSA